MNDNVGMQIKVEFFRPSRNSWEACKWIGRWPMRVLCPFWRMWVIDLVFWWIWQRNEQCRSFKWWWDSGINICYFSVNRRLDEWVDIEKVDLSTLNYENSRKDSVSSGVQLLDVSNGSDRKVTRNQKRKHDEVNHIQKVILFVTLTE